VAGLKDASVRQLQILASAASTLSFSRTAKAVHLSQPAVSMQVKALEALAGLPLFERAGRRLHLTHAGEELARHAREVLRVLEDADAAIAALRGLAAGRIRVAVTSTAKYFAPKLLARFRDRHPGVELRLRVSNREAVSAALHANEVDLAIMGRPPPDLDAVALPFADHPLVVVAPAGHPLTRRRSVPVAALAAEPFVVREPGSGTRAAMEQWFAEHRATPRVAMEMDSNETIKQAVMAGMGLSLLSRHTVGLELEVGELALVHAPGLPIMRRWNVVHRREKLLSPAARAFQEFVVEEGGAFLRQWGRR
jgi:LysR family transcriptional regulator, low CO2-responsive transcriptional regulator